jgi:sensor histidine kinase YesM
MLIFDLMSFNAIQRFYFIIGAISLGMSILIHFNSIFLLIRPDALNTSFDGETITSVLANIITTSIITFCVFAVSSYLLQPLDGFKKVQVKRFLLSVFLTLASTFILSEIFFHLNHLITGENNQGGYHLLYFFKDIFIAFIVLISVYILKIFNERKAAVTENQRLSYENLQSQYQALKNQIGPHFLFNSLTALKELIDHDPETSGKYVSHLSHVLRYTLLSNEHRTVSLSEEINSLQSYLFLYKMRFGGSLNMELNLDEHYMNYRLPPLVVQTLIENAVKHNEVSKRFPLTIVVMTTADDRLIVINKLRPRLTTEPGTGIGLANISKQYNLLGSGGIKITKSEIEFRVEVPLLEPEKYESSNS